MICIPIVADNLDTAFRDMEKASKVADILELRIDYLKRPDIKRLLERRTKPVIVTNRPVREGGKFEGSEKERLSLLKHAIHLQADYIDVEYDSIHLIQKNSEFFPASKTKLIVSYHNFHETPGNITDIYRKLTRCGADIVKIVTFANDITDNIKIYNLLQHIAMPTISFCMGEYGMISRVLYKRFGSLLTFASLEKGKESAPGQINIDTLLKTYNTERQDKYTSVYGLIGNPVSHSIGPIIHNTLFREMGFNSVYVPFKVDNIDIFLKEFTTLNVKGYSITIPHKESILMHLDDVEPMAKNIGAVNTVINVDGCLYGYNTDCEAAVATLEEVCKTSYHSRGNNSVLKGKKITMVGAGGVARAIAFGLREREAKLTIVNRNSERARLLARDVHCFFQEFQDLQKIETDILINATSVGMYPKVSESIVPRHWLKPGMVVFDTIYNPQETKLLHDAKTQGCKVLGGMPMFVQQAAAQFKLWTGKNPPMDLIERIACGKLN